MADRCPICGATSRLGCGNNPCPNYPSEPPMLERISDALRNAARGRGILLAHSQAEMLARVALETLRELDRPLIAAMEAAVEDSINETSDSEQTWTIWDANSVANAVHRAFIDTALGED